MAHFDFTKTKHRDNTQTAVPDVDCVTVLVRPGASYGVAGIGPVAKGGDTVRISRKELANPSARVALWTYEERDAAQEATRAREAAKADPKPTGVRAVIQEGLDRIWSGSKVAVAGDREK